MTMRRILTWLGQPILILMTMLFVVSGCGSGSRIDTNQDLRKAYEDFLSAKAEAYATATISNLDRVATGGELDALSAHIQGRTPSLREVSKITEFSVLYSSDTVATLQVKREYLILEAGKSEQDYPSRYWRSDTTRCDFVRESIDAPWKANFCGLVDSGF